MYLLMKKNQVDVPASHVSFRGLYSITPCWKHIPWDMRSLFWYKAGLKEATVGEQLVVKQVKPLIIIN